MSSRSRRLASSPRLVLVAIATLVGFRSLATSASDAVFHGEGTVYTLSTPASGNCNFMAYPDTAVSKYAALNTPQWDVTRNCGRCAKVSCTDVRCAGATTAADVVHIVDQCPGCAAGDLDLSPTVFRAITGLDSDRVAISWTFVDCPVARRITFCLKRGSNAFWAAVQPTNSVAGIASVEVNGQATTMVDSAYYFLLDGKSETTVDLSKLTITLVGLTGEVIADTVSFASSDCVESSKQFTPGKPATESQPPQPTSTVALTSPTMSPPPTLPGQNSERPTTAEPPIPWTQTTASPSPEATTPPAATPIYLPATAAPLADEVESEADRGATWDDTTGRPVSIPVREKTPAPPASDAASNTALAPPNDTERVKTETGTNGRSTSPEVVVLSAFGCLAAVVLVALAAYVNKKKLDDKRADSDAALHPPHVLALTSQNSSTLSGSFCQVLSPSGERRSVNFAIL